MHLKAFAFLAVSLMTTLASAQGSYPTMAPVAEYRIADRNAEIALARSAAPPSISQDAEVIVLGSKGYEVAVPGKNGFVCMVERSWAQSTEAAEFWNPKLRAPNCFNDVAAKSYLPLDLKKTEWVMAGLSKTEIAAKLKAAFEHGEFSAPATGAMAYMMSKDGYLNDADKHWHPHIMFFAPIADASHWTDNQDESPVLAISDEQTHLSVVLIPVSHWSDNSPDTGKH
jgi:hypothetical protein